MALKLGLLSLTLLGTASVVVSARADNLVTNGSFETTTNGPNQQFDLLTQATGWTSSNGYNFIYSPGAADTIGAAGQFGTVSLWGPGNGSNNGLTTSPDGGNFVAADGAFGVAPITQSISGLTPGEGYQLTFYWAGAQQSGFDSPTTEQWQVSLGSETYSTVVANNASHGFTGWMEQSFTFTPQSSTELLSFLAVGTPEGVPPFVLLDGVSMNAVPEPGTWGLMLVGMAGLGGVAWQRRRSGKAVAV